MNQKRLTSLGLDCGGYHRGIEEHISRIVQNYWGVGLFQDKAAASRRTLVLERETPNARWPAGRRQRDLADLIVLLSRFSQKLIFEHFKKLAHEDEDIPSAQANTKKIARLTTLWRELPRTFYLQLSRCINSDSTMEVGEGSVEEEDSKRPARPQHHETTDETVEETKTEYGIIGPVRMQTVESVDRMMMSATITTSSSSSGLLKRCASSYSSSEQHAVKHVKLEDDGHINTMSSVSDAESHHAPPKSSLDLLPVAAKAHPQTLDRMLITTAPRNGMIASAASLEKTVTTSSSSSNLCHGDASQVSHSNTQSNGLHSAEKHNQQRQQPPPPPEEAPEDVPLKATHFRHLQHKYLSELEYMLREFQKLERQLLGAKTQAGGAASAESAASRERREKLHSFIQHLEDTIKQIITGVELEASGKATCANQRPDRDSALSTHLTREKEEEENVQKIEEHILANLLPVKVRLKKQLAAQQGAKHNPAGMPVVRGGGMIQADTTKHGKATFLKAEVLVERRPSQFGKPLNGGGSSLTQKLHGSTLGSTNRVQGHGVDQDKPQGDEESCAVPAVAENPPAGEKEKPKILYGGLALGSRQIQSSVSAANAAHDKIVSIDPALLELRSEALHLAATPTSTDHEDLKMAASTTSDPWPMHGSVDDHTAFSDEDDYDEPDHIYSKHGTQLSLAAHAAILSYEEKRKARKKRRKKKKLLILQQQQQQQKAAAAAAALPKRKKIVKKRGPRNVEYMCALCNEVYSSTCDYNPWWALSQHDCPKCGKMQIPRIDIGAPANAIEYHPALLAHADENGGVGGHVPSDPVVLAPPTQLKASPTSASDMDDLLESDLSDDDGLLSDDDSFDCSDSDYDDVPVLSLADQAESEKFGAEYEGPKLSDAHASRLLTLMLHATTCPCRHENADHMEVCRGAKYMMLHVRDCPGTTATFDVCPFPWCRKVKHLMYHLLSCTEPNQCPICSTENLNTNMLRLRGLNSHRGEKYRSALIAKTKAAADAEVKSKAKVASKPRAAAQRKAAASKPVQACVVAKNSASTAAVAWAAEVSTPTTAIKAEGDQSVVVIAKHRPVAVVAKPQPAEIVAVVASGMVVLPQLGSAAAEIAKPQHALIAPVGAVAQPAVTTPSESAPGPVIPTSRIKLEDDVTPPQSGQVAGTNVIQVLPSADSKKDVCSESGVNGHVLVSGAAAPAVKVESASTKIERGENAEELKNRPRPAGSDEDAGIAASGPTATTSTDEAGVSPVVATSNICNSASSAESTAVAMSVIPMTTDASAEIPVLTAAEFPSSVLKASTEDKCAEDVQVGMTAGQGNQESQISEKAEALKVQ